MLAIIINVVAFLMVCALALSASASKGIKEHEVIYSISFSRALLNKRVNSIKMYVLRVYNRFSGKKG